MSAFSSLLFSRQSGPGTSFVARACFAVPLSPTTGLPLWTFFIGGTALLTYFGFSVKFYSLDNLIIFVFIFTYVVFEVMKRHQRYNRTPVNNKKRFRSALFAADR